MTALEDRLAAREKTLGLDIESRLAARESELAQTENIGSAFSDKVGESFLNTFLQSPKLLAAGAAGVQAPFSDRGFSEIFEEEKQKFPANLATNVNEVSALARALPDLYRETASRPVDQPGVENPVPLFTERFGPKFDEELGKLNLEEQRVEQKFPGATKAGDIGGNALALIAGRLPFISKIEGAEAVLAGQKFANAIKNPGIAGEFGNLVKKTIDSKGMRSLMRGSGRVTETGLEAAVLEAINGDAPLRTAAYAAGGQAIGSVALNVAHTVSSGGFVKGGLKLATLAAAYTGFIQTMKSGIPGGENNLLDSGEEAFSHLVMLMLAGGAAAAAGAGRIRLGETTLPRIAEIVSTLPRAVTLSTLSSYMGATPDEQNTIEATLNQIQQDPEFFGPEITEKLLKAMESGNLVEALREEL